MIERSLSWSIGDVSIRAFVEIADAGGIIQEILPDATRNAIKRIDWLRPSFADDAGNLKAVVQAFVIDAPEERIVVDTCVGDGRVRPDVEAWDGLQTNFLGKLESAGVARDSVDVVLCTHLHFDHVGWNTFRDGNKWVPTFPNARYLFSKAEFEYWKSRPDSEIESDHNGFTDSVLPVLEAGLVDLVAGDHRVCPEVALLPSPGHTPHHVSVLIRSEGRQALVTGDSMHHPCQIAHPDWSTLADTDRDAATRTRKSLLSTYASSNTLLIGSHFTAPTAGFLCVEGESYRLLTDETVS